MPPPAILLSDAARPFLNHMAENPDDIAARLVLCDWLQESGEEEFAEAMRRSIRTGEWVIFSREEPESVEWALREGGLGFTVLGSGEFQSLIACWAPCVAFLDLSGVDLDDDPLGLDGSIRFPLLRSLNLALSSFSIASLEVLSVSDRFPDLRSLDVSNFWGGEELAVLLAASTGFPKLESLNLSYNRIGDDGMKSLADSTAFPMLTELDLDNNIETAVGRKALADSAHLPECIREQFRDSI